MYIVKINDEKHSAWETKSEAIYQIKVLKDYGYKGMTLEFDATIEVENGRYFV